MPTCFDPECDSCNPMQYCRYHESYSRGYCDECRMEEEIVESRHNRGDIDPIEENTK